MCFIYHLCAANASFFVRNGCSTVAPGQETQLHRERGRGDGEGTAGIEKSSNPSKSHEAESWIALRIRRWN